MSIIAWSPRALLDSRVQRADRRLVQPDAFRDSAASFLPTDGDLRTDHHRRRSLSRPCCVRSSHLKTHLLCAQVVPGDEACHTDDDDDIVIAQNQRARFAMRRQDHVADF